MPSKQEHMVWIDEAMDRPAVIYKDINTQGVYTFYIIYALCFMSLYMTAGLSMASSIHTICSCFEGMPYTLMEVSSPVATSVSRLGHCGSNRTSICLAHLTLSIFFVPLSGCGVLTLQTPTDGQSYHGTVVNTSQSVIHIMEQSTHHSQSFISWNSRQHITVRHSDHGTVVNTSQSVIHIMEQSSTHHSPSFRSRNSRQHNKTGIRIKEQSTHDRHSDHATVVNTRRSFRSRNSRQHSKTGIRIKEQSSTQQDGHSDQRTVNT